MKIVKHGNNEHWICTQKFVALVSYENIIALQSINTSELVITNDRSISRTSRKHVNHLKDTCTNYMITELSQRDIAYTAIDLINASDNDPFTSDDNCTYTLSSVLPYSYARELLEKYHGVNQLNGRVKHNELYAVHNDTYAILYTGSIFLYFETHRS